MNFRAFLLQFLIFVTATTVVNAQTDSKQPPKFGQYSRKYTVFDGVTSEETVTYLNLTNGDSAFLPMTSVVNVGAPSDFTIRFWFKTTNLPKDTDVQLLSFAGSIRCRFVQMTQLICDSQDRQTISVNSNQFANGVWQYFALSVQSNGDAQLAIFDKQGLVVQSNASNFYFIQTVPSNWGVCFGFCDNTTFSQNGFDGGLREVIGLNQYQSIQQIQESANFQHYYQKVIKGYYRFQGKQRFNLEEFREIPIKLTSASDGFGQDVIANDICPATFNLRSQIVFDQLQQISQLSIGKTLKQNNYQYTMSLTFNVNSTTCYTPNYQVAQQNCSIVLLNEVFMLFFSAPNLARFHFYADKNYYESQSSSFFVPFNQQITIQMQISQFGGYQIAVLDQYSQVLQNWSKKQNMQIMKPQNKLSLFSGFQGTVNRFLLTEQAFYLPQSYSQLSQPLFDISFKSVTTQVLQNMGSGPNQLLLNQPPNFVLLPDIESDYGSQITPYPVFDGIACDDQHITLNLETVNSKFQFTTPTMSDWMSETSIQFWFKMLDWDPISFNGNEVRTILNMQTESKFESYWYIFAKSGELVVAPFGYRVPSEPTVIFGEFNQLNQDNLGWWHLSCYYQFNNQLQCTLFNTNLEVTKASNMRDLPQYFMPKKGLTAIFGNSEDKQNNAAPMLLKEVRYWNRIIQLPEVKKTRYQQIDPTSAINLISYFRLQNANPTEINFAQLNADYEFDATQTSFTGATWKPDFKIIYNTTYNSSSKSMVQIGSKQYQNICPLQTYRKQNGLCYSNPVYQAQISVFPKWNEVQSRLDWHLSVLNSKLVIDNVLTQINVLWNADDEVLDTILQDNSDQKPYLKVLPSNVFRQENTYKIRSTLTNLKNTFFEVDEISFTPNKCHWFEVGNGDSFNGYQEISVLPGLRDINFQLILVQNQELDCTNFIYFDTFKSIDFQFMIANTNSDYFIQQPNITYSLQSPSSINNTGAVNTTQAKDLIVNVRIPASEQFKIPVWTNIKILMTIDWTVEQYQNQLALNKHTFQNAMQTIQFVPVGLYLIANLNQNLQFVQRNQTLILDASNSTVSGLFPSQVNQNFTYKWTCPPELQILCVGQSESVFYVPWNSLIQVNIQWATTYQFGVAVTWHKPDNTNETRSQQVQIMWYNIAQPVFTISHSPDIILVTGTQQSQFAIVGQNFNSQGDMSLYEINWSITPDILNKTGQQFENDGQIMTIQPGSWQENTKYNISVQIIFKSQPDINGQASYQFTTTAPPKNGIISINPTYGYVGDNFTVNVTQFSDSQPVFYSVFNTFDASGSILGSQINLKSIPQGLPFTFKATKTYPIVIQVYDMRGESISQMLTPYIVQRPNPNCTTTVVCTPKNQTKPSNSTQSQNSTSQTKPTNSSGRLLQRSSDSNSFANSTVTNSTANSTCTYTTVCIPVNFDFGIYATNSTSNNQSDNSGTNSSDLQQNNTTTNVTDSQANSTQNSQQNSTVSNVTANQTNSSSSNQTTISSGNSTANQQTANNQTQQNQTTNNTQQQQTESQSNQTNSTQQQQNQTSNLIQVNMTSNQTEANTTNEPAQNVTSNNSTETNQTSQQNNSSEQQAVDTNNTTVAQDSTNSSNRRLEQSTVQQVIDSQFDSDQDLCSKLSLALIQTTEVDKINLAFNVYDKFGYICILDLINLQAQIDQQPDIYPRIIQKLKDLPISTIYQSNQIQIASQVFNWQSAQVEQKFTLQLLDASYTLDTTTIFSLFPQQPQQDFYMQGISLIGMEGETEVILRIVDSVTSETYDLCELDGRADLSFKISEQNYIPGQTVCQGMLESGSWNSEICLTEIDVDNEMANCMCSMTLGVSMISFRNDLTKQIGQPVQFPVHISTSEFQGTSYLFIAIITLISLFGFVGSVIVWKMDRNDWLEIQKLDGWKLNLVKAVAVKSGEQIELVKLRQSDIGHETTCIQLILKTHSLFAPFTQFIPTQSRLSRLSAYSLQINSYLISCMLFFGQSYRQNDLLRQEAFLDYIDIEAIQRAGLIGSVLLLPFISMPINFLLSNKLQVSSSSVKVIQQRVLLRALLILISQILNITVVIVAIWICYSTPTSNQYILASTIFTGIFISAFGTNIALSAIITTISCSPFYVKQLLKDADAIKVLKNSSDHKVVEQGADLSERCTLKNDNHPIKHQVFCIEPQT